MEQETPVGISEASRILKVSETALRQWTDEGKIRAFITPGGHRRYLLTDLKKFMTNPHKAVGIKDLAAELAGTAERHRKIGSRSFAGTSWHGRVGREVEEAMADLGSRLLQLIVKYMASSSERENTLREVHGIGEEMGGVLARAGLPLTDSVEVFVTHRDAILGVATSLMKKRGVFSGRIVDAIPLVTRVTDEALISLVAAHQGAALPGGGRANEPVGAGEPAEEK